MEIESLIIQEIKKEDGNTGDAVKYELSKSEVKNTNIYEFLVSTLNDSFDGKSVGRAKLNSDGFKKYINDFNDINITEFSKQLTEILRDQISQVLHAKGGYFIFCKYKINHNFLSVFLVRKSKGVDFKYENGSYDVEKIESPSLEKFAMGVQINITGLMSGKDIRYVRLSRGNTDTAKYFKDWIGLDDEKNPKKDSNELLNIFNHIDLPEDMNREDAKKEVVSYASRNKNIIDIRDLSQHVFGDESYLSLYITNNNIDIDDGFKMTNRTSFYRVIAKIQGIEIKADRHLIGENKDVEVLNDKIIISSRALVDKFNYELSNKDD